MFPRRSFRSTSPVSELLPALLQVVPPTSELSNFGGALNGIGLTDEALHRFAAIECGVPDSERRGDLRHKSAEPVFRQRPYFHFDSLAVKAIVAHQPRF